MINERLINEKIEQSYCGKNIVITALANGWVVECGDKKWGYDNFTSLVNEIYRIFGMHEKVGDVLEVRIK